MSLNYNQFKCPLCGKSNSTSKYDPSDFENDIIGINKIGLGYGLGFGVNAEGSILESEDPVMVRLTDRVAVLYDLLYDDDESDESEEALDESNEKYETKHETLLEAFLYVTSWLDAFLEEEPDEEEPDEEEPDEEEPDEEEPAPPHSPQPVTQELDVEYDWDEEEPEITEEPLTELDREILIG